MSDFVIRGGRPLFGTVAVGGSKNAVLPIIFAAATVKGVSVIENVPDISDVETAVFLLEELGALIDRSGTTLTVDASELSYRPPTPSAALAIRASTYLIGAELARFGKTEISSFGGCNFEPRPIDLHLYAARCMGAFADGSLFRMSKPKSSAVFFKKVSVGATANALILASSLPVLTEIYGYAREPHIKTLAEFLSSAGAKIEFSREKITVEGRELTSAHAVIPPDPIETGTFALLSLASGGNITVKGTPSGELTPLLAPLVDAGAEIAEEGGGFRLFGELRSPCSFFAEPYPGLATDLQPLTVPVLARFLGGEVRDSVFPKRFGYASELGRFGVFTENIPSGVRVLPSKFSRARAEAVDLRGGAALLFPALISEGESVISSAHLIKRGYSDLVKKLSAIGADIIEK